MLADSALKPKAGDVQLVDEVIYDPHRAVFADVVIDPFGKKCGLLAVLSLDKSAHRDPLQLESSILLSEQGFHTATARPGHRGGFSRYSSCRSNWTPEGLPVGIQLAAPFGAEALLLRLATQLERPNRGGTGVPKLAV